MHNKKEEGNQTMKKQAWVTEQLAYQKNFV